MNIYDAIMKAADTIEFQPDSYDFFQCNVHSTCRSPHCMVGWIGFYLGMHGKRVYTDVLPALGLSERCTIGQALGADGTDYVHNTVAAAAALRKFAQRFKPVIIGIPASVRDIFTNPRQTISDTAPDQRFA